MSKKCLNTTPPSWLRLQFSMARDHTRITSFLSDKNRSVVDPNHFVLNRRKEYRDFAIDNGNAAFLEDSNGDIYSIAFNYTAMNGESPYEVIGTTLTRLPGYKTGSLLIAALALQRWWKNEIPYRTVTKAGFSNKSSMKMFRRLGLKEIINPLTIENIEAFSTQTLIEESHTGAWFLQTQKSLKPQSRLFMNYTEKGLLTSQYNRNKIALDITAFFACGLTFDILQSIAKGIDDKQVLCNIAKTRQYTPSRPQLTPCEQS